MANKKSVSLKIGTHKSRSGGLTAAGRAKYNKATGSNLKAPQPEGGPRKKSFCARMSGVKGPMKDEKGRPTRKARGACLTHTNRAEIHSNVVGLEAPQSRTSFSLTEAGYDRHP
jgi:hypothetical protein